MWSPGTGNLLPLSHTEGWLWSQGQVSQAECAAKACVLVMYSLLGLLPHKYIRQPTQKTLTTARSHKYTHTLCMCACVCICVYMCIHMYIEVSLNSLTHRSTVSVSLSFPHKKRHSVCLFPALSVPGAVLNAPPLALSFSISSSLAFWCQMVHLTGDATGSFFLLET